MPQESSDESGDSSDNELERTPPPIPPTKVAKVPQKEEDEDDDSEADSESRSMITKTATPSAARPATTKRARDESKMEAEPKQQEDGNKPKKSRKSDNAGDKSANVGEGKSAKKSDNAGAKKSDKLGDGKKSTEAGGEEAEPKRKSNAKKKKDDLDKSTSEAEKPEEKQVAKLVTKKACTFHPKDESMIARRLLDDLKTGVDFYTKSKSDNYWDDLRDGLQGKLSRDFTKDQIYDKCRRMKRKYMTQEKSGRNDELQTIFKQLYDREIAKDKRKGNHSDVEESQETSGPQAGGKAVAGAGNGNVDKAAVTEVSRMIKNLESTLLESVSSATVADPVINLGSSLCTGVISWMKNQKLGSDSSKGGKDARKRVLEEQVAEYGNMKRRLKLVMDYCELEEELLQKKLGNL